MALQNGGEKHQGEVAQIAAVDVLLNKQKQDMKLAVIERDGSGGELRRRVHLDIRKIYCMKV